MSAGQEQRDDRLARRSRVDVVRNDDAEDWPLLSFLFAGLALALMANTFVGLVPG